MPDPLPTKPTPSPHLPPPHIPHPQFCQILCLKGYQIKLCKRGQCNVGDCRRQLVTYNIYLRCHLPGGEHLRDKVAAYSGETGRNLLERGKQHLANQEKHSKVDYMLWLHSLPYHQGRLDIQYTMVCTGSYRSPQDS